MYSKGGGSILVGVANALVHCRKGVWLVGRRIGNGNASGKWGWDMSFATVLKYR